MEEFDEQLEIDFSGFVDFKDEVIGYSEDKLYSKELMDMINEEKLSNPEFGYYMDKVINNEKQKREKRIKRKRIKTINNILNN